MTTKQKTVGLNEPQPARNPIDRTTADNFGCCDPNIRVARDQAIYEICRKGEKIIHQRDTGPGVGACRQKTAELRRKIPARQEDGRGLK